ncbi:hypothetical protein [Shewanella sp.]|uniref:hypothetical protein n=1 Tax=Shewanella sp. TaxID=50422 RepID=UPI003565221D
MKGKLVLGLCSMFLGACGGSGGSDGSSGSGPNTPSARLVGDFFQQATACDLRVANTSVQIVVHKKDGSVAAVHWPDSNGHLDIPWPADAEHLTLIKNTNGALDIDTALDFSGEDLGIRVSYDASLNESCECKTLVVDPSQLMSTYPEHSIYLQGNKVVESSSRSFCKVPGQQYSSVDLWLTPSQSNDNAYGALLDINANMEQLELTPGMVSGSNNMGQEVSFYEPYGDVDYLRVYGLNADGRRHQMGTPSPLYVFPGIHSNNFLQGYRTKFLGSTAEGEMTYHAARRMKVTDPGQMQNLEIADNDQQLLVAVNALLQGFDSDSAVNYNIEGIGSGRAGLFVWVYGPGLDWSIDGPLKGTVPDLNLPPDVETLFETKTISSISFSSSGYRQSGGINELRKQLATESRSGSKLRPAFFDNYDYEEIRVNVY